MRSITQKVQQRAENPGVQEANCLNVVPQLERNVRVSKPQKIARLNNRSNRNSSSKLNWNITLWTRGRTHKLIGNSTKVKVVEIPIVPLLINNQILWQYRVIRIC